MKRLDERDNIKFQAEKHELVKIRGFLSCEDYLLFLIHKKPYEDISTLSAGKHVLDLGCNNGYGTNLIASRCNTIIGADVSAKAIRAAKGHFAKNNIDFLEIDGDSLPFSDADFDIVTCFHVIEHVLDTKRFLQEICRVLKPGGCVVFTTPNAKIRLPEGMKSWNRFHIKEYSASGLRSLLGDHFSNVSIEGMFARPFLYEIERSRILRALSAAKKAEQGINKRPSFRCMIPSFIKNTLKHFRFMLKDRKQLRKFIQTYSTSDLFYSTENLDDSLDFRANCII